MEGNMNEPRKNKIKNHFKLNHSFEKIKKMVLGSSMKAFFTLVFVLWWKVDLQVESRECSWTGCQPDTWMIRGCNLYKQVDMSICTGGHGAKYRCCDWDSERASSPKDYLKDCNWTNCKSKNSNRSCEIDQQQIATAPCDSRGGFKYRCCPIKPVPPQLLNAKCWWTACQLNSLVLRGCPETTILAGKMNCSNGEQYKCCIPAVRLPKPKSAAPIPKEKEKCSLTECQRKTQPVRGCPANSQEKSRDNCTKGGLVFTCCVNGLKRVELVPKATQGNVATAATDMRKRFG